MKKASIILLIFTFFNYNFSQNSSYKYEFVGALELSNQGNQLITYKLCFDEHDGLVDGYTVTDLGGNHETKNIISGTYSSSDKLLKFKEDEILYSKSPISQSSFCYVNFEGKIKLKDNSTRLQGDFKGLFNNKTECINGSLMLVSSKMVNKIISKVDNKIQNSKKFDSIKSTGFNARQIVDSLNVNRLTKNQNLSLFFKNDKVTFKIWDSGKEDGDIVDVKLNGSNLLSNYTVKSKVRYLSISLNNEKTELELIAKNHGDLGINTPKIEVTDGVRTFTLDVSLKESEKSKLTFYKKAN